MTVIRSLLRQVALLCAMLMLFYTVAVPAASAAVISSGDMVVSADLLHARETVASFMAREDVRAAFEKQGINPDEAAIRVNNLSDKETIALSEKIETLPAGGDMFSTLIAAGLFVFVVLLITDLAGLTDVFPFVRK